MKYKRTPELNTAALGNLAQGLHNLLPPATWAQKYRPPIMNAPVGPPKARSREPGEVAALRAPQKIALPTQDCTPQIAEPLEDSKSPLPSEPIVLETLCEELLPTETIGCRVQLRLALGAEGRRAAPAFSHFEGSDTFCRLAVSTVNVEHPAIRACLEKSNAGGIQFFVAAALVKRVSGDPSALAIARSPLMAVVEGLPIFGSGFSARLGNSFPLAEIDLQIATSALGPPWDRSPERKDTNHGRTWLDQ
jgi:hypothetical protein